MATRNIAIALVLAAGAATVAGTSASAAPDGARGCAWQFDTAVARYVATTDARDAKAFNALVHPDVVGVLPGGSTLVGKPAFAGFIERFFARTDWTQTFTVKHRAVDGCSTATVLFESVYSEPAAGYRQTLMIGITWTREHGRWLVLHDQNTVVE
ncbi:uncharacterized protein (TIGR02246 family) [Herbihabitans rhizosphaerae]|uniref:Uncharacterized protein (TIGR02246 family) n=1 Tax=Herbihabitans rhizosphaerae TaxID=1872711 RepID=A0A4Q7L605_9PSEU|nr:nuclear transport factor 2 family protein [Herbihabitans rhizosphaerae]RZS44270.1 uncharacterized protein (TIGR02246 family) [Herbihabitans rhizosphaerae]